MIRKLILYSFVFLWGGCGVCAGASVIMYRTRFPGHTFVLCRLAQLILLARLDLGLIRFGGHLPKGEYDVDHDGDAGQADAAELHG